MFKNILKAGLLFFAVGALLSLAAPFIGAAVGLAPTVAEAGIALGHTSSPLWMGAFFGAFGAIDAGIRPVFEKIFGGGKAATEAAAKPEAVESKAPQLGMEGECCGKHRDALAAERASPATRQVG